MHQQLEETLAAAGRPSHKFTPCSGQFLHPAGEFLSGKAGREAAGSGSKINGKRRPPLGCGTLRPGKTSGVSDVAPAKLERARKGCFQRR